MISVNSNSLSLLVQKNLAKETNCVNTALERMSTGYKVNRAKDDAANLQISEGLTTGINSAKILKNGASTALNMLSTTEGILNSMTDSLLRIRDLTLQKMNGVYDENALASMNKEIQAQVDNIVQLSKKADFNGKKLLDGSVKDMLIPLYDDGNSGLESIDMTELFSELDFIDVLTGEKDLYFVQARAGEKYYADFDGKVFEITSDKDRQVIYKFDEATGSIEFVECEDVSAVELGDYKNDYTSLGNGEQYLQMEANKSYYLKHNNKVYEFKNTNAISQIAIIKDNGAGGLDLTAGEGVQKTELYDLDTYTSINSGQSLKLNAGSSQHIVFNNKLYEISSSKNQTLIFNNKNGNLNPLAGTEGVTINTVGNMKTGVTTGLASYIMLNPKETKYYEYNGNIFKITNSKSTKQNFLLDSNNNIKDSNGNVVRTQLASSSIRDFSSYTNLQSMSVTAGNDYYLKNSDGSGVTKITANQSGTIYFDKTMSGYNKFQGVSVTSSAVSNYEEVSPDSSNQFSLSVKSGETKYISLNKEIYTVKNDTGADFTKTFEYDSAAKTVIEVINASARSSSGAMGGITQLTEAEAIAQGYIVLKTADDLNNIRNNMSEKYILMGDIDLSVYANWDPIGEYANQFTGTIDGNGYVIKNLKIDKSSQSNVGFIGYANGATIKNIQIENADIKGGMAVGAVVGYDRSSNISNCFVSGTISGSSYVGGVVGQNKLAATLDGCYSSAVVSCSSSNAGGIIGVAEGTVSNCYADGIISGKNNIGGIVGGNSKKLSNSYFNGTVTGETNVGGVIGQNNLNGSVSGAFWDVNKSGTTIGVGYNESRNPSAISIEGLTTSQMSDPQKFIDAGWDSSIWDLDNAPPKLKTQSTPTPPIPIEGTYIADFSTSTSQTASNLRYMKNVSGTSYFKFGDDIYEIKNKGTTQDVFFDYDSTTGTLSAKNASDLELKKIDKAVFNSLNNSNFSTQMNAGESQYMSFTINGVQRVYKVTNNSTDKQSVVFEKTNTVSIKSGDGVVIEEYTDMVKSTGVSNNSFYIDFAGETKKNIYLNGKFFEITNNDGTTALFRPNGSDLKQYSGNSTSHTSKTESPGTISDISQYSIELDPNETRYIKIGDLAFELKNNTTVKQTQIFTQNGFSLAGLNPNVSSRNLSLSNSPMQQMLIVTDYSLEDVSSRLSQLGAYANAINASISRNTNVEQNFTAAKSTIMDADIAEESCRFVQNQILQSISSSLLSQVNTIKREVVLQLIR